MTVNPREPSIARVLVVIYHGDSHLVELWREDGSVENYDQIAPLAAAVTELEWDYVWCALTQPDCKVYCDHTQPLVGGHTWLKQQARR